MNVRQSPRLRMWGWVAALVLVCVGGCAATPVQRIVPDGFAPPGTPVDVQLVWDATKPAAYYDHTEGGMTLATLQDPLLFVLLLPVSLTVDASIAASNASRARKARQLAESVTGLPDRSTVESRLTEVLRAELGWVAIEPAASDAPITEQSTAAAITPLVLTIRPVFALRKDGGALLFDFHLAFCRAESVFEGKRCADDLPVEARVLVHSDPAPESARGATTDERISANVDYWVGTDGGHLKEGFQAAAAQLATVMHAMREHTGPPASNSMSVTRVIFPYFYDGELRTRDLDLIETEPDGRRILRTRAEPMRSGGTGDDPVANVWLSVPMAPQGDESAEEALIEFMYAWTADPK